MDNQEQEICQDQEELGPPSEVHSSNGSLTSGSAANERRRPEYRWSKAARDLVRSNRAASLAELTNLVTRLVEESGYPRRACWKFVRQMGIRSKRGQRQWSQAERQRLEKLIDLHSVNEIAAMLRRSPSSVWHALYRMGASAAMRRDGFTKNTLAVALHISSMQVETWINRGWLKAREVQTGQIKRIIIAAQDFCEFCRAHTKDVVGNRLSKERLEFVYHFAFPRSHAELLPVRESKKERSAFAAQKGNGAGGESPGFCPESEEEEDDALGRIA